jgi:hypothetical protein
MVKGDEKTSNDIFQLALNKDGVLRGNYYDAVSDASTPVKGSLEKKTQRVGRQSLGCQRVPGGFDSEPERSMDSQYGQRAATRKLTSDAAEPQDIVQPTRGWWSGLRSYGCGNPTYEWRC